MEFRYREESENVRYNYVLELCSKLAFAKEIRTYDVENAEAHIVDAVFSVHHG